MLEERDKLQQFFIFESCAINRAVFLKILTIKGILMNKVSIVFFTTFFGGIWGAAIEECRVAPLRFDETSNITMGYITLPSAEILKEKLWYECGVNQPGLRAQLAKLCDKVAGHRLSSLEVRMMVERTIVGQDLLVCEEIFDAIFKASSDYGLETVSISQ